MRTEKEGERWIIVRGTGSREQYFSFFVDYARSSWTKTKPWSCRKYHTEQEAISDLDELLRRARLKKKS